LSVIPEELLRNIIEEFKSKQVTPLETRSEKAAASMASASAIPYGKTLAQTEMENLFDTLFACTAPNYSPSGKAVISIITLEDLEKRFI
jgi:DNA mismatch repair protein MutL